MADICNMCNVCVGARGYMIHTVIQYRDRICQVPSIKCSEVSCVSRVECIRDREQYIVLRRVVSCGGSLVVFQYIAIILCGSVGARVKGKGSRW